MKNLSVALTTLVCLFCLPANADQAPKAEVLFTGDSWVTVPCLLNSIGDAFFNRHLNVSDGDCFSTSHIGANADNFKTSYSSNYNATMERLKTQPFVKVVYISLGGNDMFKYWTTTMGAEAEAALDNRIKSYIAEYINDIHAVRPDVWILISGYDNGYMYANNPFSGYRKIYEHMGEPTPAQVYGGFERLYQILATLAGDHTAFQQHVGLMHYYYGAPEAGVPPYQTLAPALISPHTSPITMGGVPGVRNNKYAMAHIFDWFFDPHHLRPKGFMRLFEHAIDGYMGKWLVGASYKAPSAEDDAAEDAQVTEVSDVVQARVQKMVNDAYDKLY